MKKFLFILASGLLISLLHSCSNDDFPVPPASTVADFSTAIDNDAFAPATVTFTNKSIVPERAGTVAYYWNFGDGSSSTEANPTHLYEAPGAYSVNLVVVTQGSNEINEMTRTIVIKDPNATGAPVFFTNGSIIYTALINSQAPIVTPVDNLNSFGDVYGMTIDTVNMKLYIADFTAGKIFRSDLDGSNLEEFRTGIGEPDALVIDYNANQLYWDTNSGIRRADLSNTTKTQFEEFVTGQANDPEGIAIDPVSGKLYWNNYDGGVWSKNLNGTGETEIIPGGQGGGSIIVVGDKIYFDEYIASGDIHLKSANLNGTGVATIATGISRVVYGIAYDQDEEKIYWVDRNVRTIMRANLDGTSPEPWYVSASVSPRGLVIGKKM